LKDKRYIELEDIIGVRLECKSCGLILEGTTEALAEPAKQRLLGQCPSQQNHTWTGEENALYLQSADTFVKEFIRNLKAFRDRAPKIGCSFSFEIKQDRDSGA
jgi:hypothetical protein